MKKTIDEIVNNANYERLNEALKERSLEIAEIIRNEMQKLNIKEIGDYRIITVRTRSGFSDTELYILNETDCWCDKDYNALETTKSEYYCGDFNCYITAATTQQRIQFLNDAKEIFETIDKIKEERVKKIDQVLKDTSDIKKNDEE